MSDLATLVDSLTKEVGTLKTHTHSHANDKHTDVAVSPSLLIPTAEVLNLNVLCSALVFGRGKTATECRVGTFAGSTKENGGNTSQRT